MNEHAQEQALKALKDASRFLLDVDRRVQADGWSWLRTDASRVRAEVDFALQLAGKL